MQISLHLLISLIVFFVDREVVPLSVHAGFIYIYILININIKISPRASHSTWHKRWYFVDYTI